jgi:hypothetical protein
MAREIAPTPILTGKDAKRFREAMENLKPWSEEKKRELDESYELFKQRANFYLP